MRKLVLSALLAFAFCSISAQNKILFGFRGALNVNSLTYSSGVYNNYGPGSSQNSSSSSTGSMAGVTAGFFLEAPLAREFSVEPELNYALKGGQNTDGDAINRTQLSYVSLPVLFKYKPRAVRGLNVFFGPEFAALVGASDVYTKPGVRNSYQVKGDFKTFDLGLDIGIGYDFLRNLGLDFRYGAGVTNVSRFAGTTMDEGRTYTSAVRNGTFQFGIRFMFNR